MIMNGPQAEADVVEVEQGGVRDLGLRGRPDDNGVKQGRRGGQELCPRQLPGWDRGRDDLYTGNAGGRRWRRRRGRR